MKKIISMICVCVLSLSLFGCSKPENNVLLKKNVSCKLLDVLTITNDSDNSTYYYYLASIENKGKNCKYCGCWKVYSDETACKKLFQKYKKCTSVYCDCFLRGVSILKLTVAA